MEVPQEYCDCGSPKSRQSKTSKVWFPLVQTYFNVQLNNWKKIWPQNNFKKIIETRASIIFAPLSKHQSVSKRKVVKTKITWSVSSPHLSPLKNKTHTQKEQNKNMFSY